MSVVLKTEDLSLSFGGFPAVKAVGLEVHKNTVHSIIGPNGAGKTTLFNLLAGHYLPTAGQVNFEGKRVTRVASHRRIKCGIGRCFQVTNLFSTLSVRENLRIAAQGRMASRAFAFWRGLEAASDVVDTAESVLKRLELEPVVETLAGALSHGQQRVLEVGMALAGRPRLLLLDEPTSGMGVDDLPRMQTLIQDLARDHTVLLVEHNMRIVMNISDRITVMFQGGVLLDGEPADIRQSEDVRRVYLGAQSGRNALLC